MNETSLQIRLIVLLLLPMLAMPAVAIYLAWDRSESSIDLHFEEAIAAEERVLETVCFQTNEALAVTAALVDKMPGEELARRAEEAVQAASAAIDGQPVTDANRVRLLDALRQTRFYELSPIVNAWQISEKTIANVDRDRRRHFADTASRSTPLGRSTPSASSTTWRGTPRTCRTTRRPRTTAS